MKKNLNILIFILTIGFYNCSETNNSNNIDSDEYDSKEKRVKILKKEIKPYSDFDNAEFELFNVNGFSNNRTSVPGTSSLDYKFVIKVTPSNINNWIEGMIKVDSINFDSNWTTEIIDKRKNDWKIKSHPEFYIREGENVILIVFRTEGIIFKRVIDN